MIESVSVHGGPASVIKSHHNVGGLPADLGLGLVEPFRFLFKDEVRAIGTKLGLSDAVVWRQPFPGPGLGVRILGDITPERVRVLQEADAIVREELAKAGLERVIWQAFAVLLPSEFETRAKSRVHQREWPTNRHSPSRNHHHRDVGHQVGVLAQPVMRAIVGEPNDQHQAEENQRRPVELTGGNVVELPIADDNHDRG